MFLTSEALKVRKANTKIGKTSDVRNEYVKQSFPAVPTQHIYFRCLRGGYVSKYYKRPGRDWKLDIQNQY